jgi:hypothetical protein
MSIRVLGVRVPALAAVSLVAATLAAPHAGAVGRHTAIAPTVRAGSAAKPGKSGTPIVLSRTVSLTGGSVDMATAKSGTTYLGWLATDHSNEGAGELVHLCVLPLHATGCQGGVQTTSPLETSGALNLKIIVAPSGVVTFVWYDQVSLLSEIVESTVQSNGTLSTAHDVATAPANGEMLDAELGPDGTIWTVSASDSGDTIKVRDGLANPEQTIHTPDEVDFARLAFAGKTAIIAMHDSGALIDPVRYSYLSGGHWTKVASVARTETGEEDLGLVTTKSGVRLMGSERDADLRPVVAKWTGHGFSGPVVAEPKVVFNPDGTDLVADPSGRAANVSFIAGGSKLAIANLADTVHGAVVTIPTGGTSAAGFPQISTNPRGQGWVAWAIESHNSTDGDIFTVAPVLLPAVQRSGAHRGSAGSVTVSGPVSCMPGDTTPVAVKGHAAHGWKVASHKLLLGHKKLGKTLNGASLKAGKSYSLKGTVVFAKNGAHSTVSATLRFRSCPNP